MSFSSNSWAFYFELKKKIKSKSDSLEYDYIDDLDIIEPLEFTGKKYEKNVGHRVLEIQSNLNYTAILLENRSILFFPIEDDYMFGESEPMIFPESSTGKDSSIMFMHLTPFFLVYVTEVGSIHYFELDELIEICNYKHNVLKN